MSFATFWVIGFIFFWVMIHVLMLVDQFINDIKSGVDDLLGAFGISLVPFVNMFAGLVLFVLMCHVIWDGRDTIVRKFNSFRGK